MLACACVCVWVCVCAVCVCVFVSTKGVKNSKKKRINVRHTRYTQGINQRKLIEDLKKNLSQKQRSLVHEQRESADLLSHVKLKMRL